MSSVLSFQERVRAERHTLLIAGELDMATAPEFEAKASELCADGRVLILDLSRLTFIDSTGLLAILRTRGLCDARRCELRLVPGPPAVQRLFQLTGLLERLPFVKPSS